MEEIIPTEDQEQEVFIQYLRLKGYDYFRVPNETYTKSWSQKAKNKRLGVVKGIPDLFVIKDNKLIAVEMKRRKGGRTTPEQKEWIEKLNNAGVKAAVCNGHEAAINFVEGE